jgi:probable rRNA maturation factor
MKVNNDTFYINNKTKAKLPSLAFRDMKTEVLGSDYELTLNIVSESEIKRLNTIYRDIEKSTDILSFPVDDKVGEIFINLKQTKLESVKFGRKYENFLAFLFIHGLVHLKGFDHSSKMESIEEKIRAKFGI